MQKCMGIFLCNRIDKATTNNFRTLLHEDFHLGNFRGTSYLKKFRHRLSN
jgi:hypothetical protein